MGKDACHGSVRPQVKFHYPTTSCDHLNPPPEPIETEMPKTGSRQINTRDCPEVWVEGVGAGVTYVAAMTTSSEVMGWVSERSCVRLSLRSTAELRDRGLGTPPSPVFSSSWEERGINKGSEMKTVSEFDS